MKFITTYKLVLTQLYPSWKLPEKDNPIFTAIYELADAFDESIPSQIKLQDKSAFIGVSVSQAIMSKPHLSKGSSTPDLASMLSEFFTQEIALWHTIWAELKTIAISTGTSTGTYPPALSYTGKPSNGEIIKSLLLSSSTDNTPGQKAIAYALEKYLTYWYTYYIMSGPPITYEVNY